MAAHQQKASEIRLTNCEDLKNDLNNIAANIGIPLASLLKMKLREMADHYPSHMREKKKNY